MALACERKYARLVEQIKPFYKVSALICAESLFSVQQYGCFCSVRRHELSSECFQRSPPPPLSPR